MLITALSAQQNSVEELAVCELCQSSSYEVVSTVDRYKKPLTTAMCNHCGLMYTLKNRIENIQQFYAEDYRGTGEKPLLKHVLRHANTALERYKRIKNYLYSGKKLLDIGSGGGEFVYLAQSIGLKAKGIEPHQRYATYCNRTLGINVEISFLEPYTQSTTDRFDIITIFHVLEHLQHPLEILKTLNTLLNPNGLCIIEVPDMDAFSMTPKNLFHVEHLYHFNENTLTFMAEKAGFQKIEIIKSHIEGNMTLIFQKLNEIKSTQSVSPELMLKNYQQLNKKMKVHNNVNHYFMPYPYLRFALKMLRYAKEFLQIQGQLDAKSLLNLKYSKPAQNHLTR